MWRGVIAGDPDAPVLSDSTMHPQDFVYPPWSSGLAFHGRFLRPTPEKLSSVTSTHESLFRWCGSTPTVSLALYIDYHKASNQILYTARVLPASHWKAFRLPYMYEFVSGKLNVL